MQDAFAIFSTDDKPTFGDSRKYQDPGCFGAKLFGSGGLFIKPLNRLMYQRQRKGCFQFNQDRIFVAAAAKIAMLQFQ